MLCKNRFVIGLYLSIYLNLNFVLVVAKTVVKQLCIGSRLRQGYVNDRGLNYAKFTKKTGHLFLVITISLARVNVKEKFSEPNHNTKFCQRL